MDLVRVAPVTADLESELVASYPGLVRRLALVLRNASDAEDVAQAAFARALERRRLFADGDVRAWLYTIGLRLAFNERDRRRRWRGFLERQRPEIPSWVRPDHRELHRALAGLPRPQRIAIFLNAVDGYTQAEIAGMLDVPPGTVASWLSRAKTTLREVLRND